jgi:CelD/BcsL family acetyltransferase involved in cellulose biosynthesis
MSSPSAPVTLFTTIHHSPQAFEQLRDEWNEAVRQAQRPSLFVTPLFLECTWRHHADAGDELWLVIVRDEAERMVGALPLVRTTARRMGLAVHTLQHLGQWSGDRAGVLHLIDADRVWQAALEAVVAQQEHWHHLDLREVEQTAWPVRDAASMQAWAGVGVRPTVRPDTWCGALTIQGDWDDYFASRTKNTRQGFRRRERLMKEAFPDLAVEIVDDEAGIGAAFERYIAIERLGWKAEQRIGIWQDPREAEMHRELLPRLAATGQASVWLLRAGGRDIAGLVRLHQGPICYERYSSYDPAEARFSPGTWLCMEAVRQLFGTDCIESDVLGMHEPLQDRPAISAWYDIERPTVRLTATRTHLGRYLAQQAGQAAQLVRAHPARSAALSAAMAMVATLTLID